MHGQMHVFQVADWKLEVKLNTTLCEQFIYAICFFSLDGELSIIGMLFLTSGMLMETRKCCGNHVHPPLRTIKKKKGLNLLLLALWTIS